IWKGFARLADPRVDNFRPIEPLPDFATNTYLLSGLHLTPLIGVKMQPAQVKASRAIRNGGHQLTARPQLNLAMENFAFNLNSAARHCGTDAVYASFVLVTDGQMDDVIRRLSQAEPLELALQLARCGFIRTASCCGGRLRHV